jgi:hypothetical protein
MQKVNILDDFYSMADYGMITSELKTTSMSGTYLPRNIYYPSRLHAYPCWETQPLPEDNLCYLIFKQTFMEKTNLKPKNIKTFFRKIVKKELEQSPFAGREEGLIHKDDEARHFAGIIYFDSFSIKDGTRIYAYDNQIEPDIIVGSKPNRCLFYPTNVNHSAGIDWRKEERTVQVFFLETE